MSLFIFQNSRWQYLAYLTDTINELSEGASHARGGKEASKIQRRHDNLSRAARAIERNISGPSLLNDAKNDLLNLTPTGERHKAWYRALETPAVQPLARRGTIKGIPDGVDINHEGHIY